MYDVLEWIEQGYIVVLSNVSLDVVEAYKCLNSDKDLFIKIHST